MTNTQNASANAPPKRTPGRPFQPGNPGKRKGTRHRITLAMEALLDGESEALTRKAIELALGGDITALRLCLDRLAPPRRDRHVTFELPPIKSAADAAVATGALVAAVAEGDLTPSEAAEVARVIEMHIKVLEAVELERRLSALEERTSE
jgi:hypothetical protein